MYGQKGINMLIKSKFIFAMALIFIAHSAYANARYASIILEESSGKILFFRNADKPLYPASLTKLMTLYLLFEAMDNKKLNFSTRMRVSRIAASRSPSKLYLRVGQTISVKEAIQALITKSANDVATVVAEHLNRTERQFAQQMTRKAKALGMRNTRFKNASGLPNRAQLSTARDMSKLALALRRDFPHYFKFFKQTSFQWKGRKFRNHNRLLHNFVGTDGMKTGYTSASGFNLVATAERNGVRLIGVVFGGKTGRSRDRHMMHLLARQFRTIKPIEVRTLPALPLPRPDRPLQIVRSVPKTSPPKTPTTNWAIQVGSYTRRVSAHKAAITARQTAGQLLHFMPAELSLINSGGLPLWRVRFSQLKEQDAKSACAALLSTGAACIAIPLSLTESG